MMRYSILFLSLVIIACGNEKTEYEEVRPVRTLTVGAQGAAAGAELSGDVRARYEVAQSFRIGGKLVERRVEVGSVVKAGEMLARLDAQDVGLNAAAVKAQLDAAKTDLAQLELNLRRSRELLAQKFVSQAEVDSRQSAFDAGQRKLEQAEAQWRIAQNQSSYATLHADAAGVVTSVDAEAGQVVAAGQSVVRIAKAGEREVVVDVAEARRAEIKVGQAAQVSLWAVPGKVWQGRVREIAPAADAQTRTYRTRIQLQDADEGVKLGMSASVRLLAAAQSAGAVALPLSAVFGEGAAAKIWILNADGRVQSRAVKVVDTSAEALKVDGVKAGEVVVTAGVHLLREGQKVRRMTVAEQR